MKQEPYSQNEARKLISEIRSSGGSVSYSKHVEAELANDNLTAVDAENVLRAGRILDPAEFENGTWRYRVQTSTIVVVIAFRGETGIRVVTAWRKKPSRPIS